MIPVESVFVDVHLLIPVFSHTKVVHITARYMRPKYPEGVYHSPDEGNFEKIPTSRINCGVIGGIFVII